MLEPQLEAEQEFALGNKNQFWKQLQIILPEIERVALISEKAGVWQSALAKQVHPWKWTTGQGGLEQHNIN